MQKSHLTVLIFAFAASIGLAFLVHPNVSRVASPTVPNSTAPTQRQAPPEHTALEQQLANIDRQIADFRQQATLRDDDWLSYEYVAGLYLDRSKLSGDWADFAHCEEALRLAFARAPTGGGPHRIRAAFNYTVHRLSRVDADLNALDGYAIRGYEQNRFVRGMRADVAFHSGRYSEAQQLYQANVAEDPTPTALVAMAQYHWKTGDFDLADTMLTNAEARAESMSPSGRAWIALVHGLMNLDRNDYAQAAACYRRGLLHFPDFWLLEEHLAEVTALMGRTDEAKVMYQGLIARTHNPEFMDALAMIHREQGDEADFQSWRIQARTLFEARIADFPEAAMGHALDHFLELEDNAARAVELAEHNRNERPGGEALTKLARAYVFAGRLADAKRIVDEMVASAWALPESLAVAAQVYELSGDVHAAAVQRARAEALVPGIMAGASDLVRMPAA